jgi:hypothetical protein
MLIYIFLIFILIILVSIIIIFNQSHYDFKKIYGGEEDNHKLAYNGNIPFSHMKQTMEKIGWEYTESKIIHFSFDDKNAILYGQIPQLGIEFSDKKRLEKHFSNKHYFPKWDHKKSGICICRSINNGDHSKNILITNTPPSNSNWVITKYIDNPLLYEKKKFNLQIFIALYIRPPRYLTDKQLEQAIIFTDYNMQCASHNYMNSNYDNKNIHISNKEINISEEELKKRNRFISELDIMPQIYEILYD